MALRKHWTPRQPLPNDARHMILAVLSEQEFMARLEGVARRTGWLDYHTRRSDGSTAGFPDLVLLKQGVLIVAELKSEIGQLTPPQERWLTEFAMVPGLRVVVWRPTQLDAIEAYLEGRGPFPEARHGSA